MEKPQSPTAKRLGRPLSFDRDNALNAALLQFWQTGYETTSVAELTHAMGITAPSLYTAFGDKESLFLECLEKYANPGPKTTAEQIAEAPSAREAAQQLLEVSAQWFTQQEAPAGCLVASAASSGSANSRKVRAALKDIRDANRKALSKKSGTGYPRGATAQNGERASSCLDDNGHRPRHVNVGKGRGQSGGITGLDANCDDCVANGSVLLNADSGSWVR